MPRRRSAVEELTTPETTAENAEAVQPQTEMLPAAEAAPKRRGGRRTKTDETAVPPPIEAAPPDAPASEAPPRRRGRPRKADTDSAFPASDLTLQPEADSPRMAETAASDDLPVPRRIGGRRSRAVLPADALPEAAAEVESAPPVARRRRSRRRTAEASPVSDDMLVPAEDASALSGAGESAPLEEGGTEDSEARRAGRGRRGGRRRRSDANENLLVRETDTLLLEEEPSEPAEEEIDEGLPLFAPIQPIYAAPPLVPLTLAPADDRLPRVAASLAHPPSGLAQIVVNGEPHAPYLFFVNTQTALEGEVVDSQIRGAASVGIHLFSGVMYLPLKNAYGDRAFGAIDAFVQQVLAADPEGWLIPRLQFVPTNYWARMHPDQLARYADGSEGDVSVASAEFWADCVDALEALVAHFADPSTPGGDRVIGFQLDRGEWFYDAAAGYDFSEPNRMAFQNWLRAKYQGQYALRAAWFDGAVTFDSADIPAWPSGLPGSKKGETPLYAGARDGRWPDYALFASDLVAGVIIGLAAAVKTLSGERLLVAVSYGYTLEFAARSDSGHLALGQLLASPDIDIVAGPNSYASRGAGSPGAFGAPIDSVALHGKLWLVEDDTKTFLADAETEDTYNPKIAGGADTQAIHQRHFGAALAHRAGVTWMDSWGQGWLDHPEIWREFGALRNQAELWGRIAGNHIAPPDVAVLVDEASLAYIKSDPAGLGASLVSRTRDLLLRAGASVGFYLQSDIRRDDFPEATLYLFLNAVRVTSGERLAIRERLQRPGKTLAWVYAPGLFNEKGAATEEMSEIVGMALRLQPWNACVGSQLTGARHPITERLRGGKNLGQEEILNPSFAVSDPQATVLAEYVSTGAPSLAVREHEGGWKSVFFGDPYLTAELLRGLYAYAGVPIYDAQDDVVAASGDGVLLVHTPYAGQRTLTLPRAATVYDAIEHRIVATDARSFRIFLRPRTTHLYLWGDAAAVAAATGLTLPAAQERLPAEPEQMPPPESGEVSRDLDSVLEVVVETVILSEGIMDNSALSLTEDGEDAPMAENLSAPRSHWQRRRAALRARRESARNSSNAEDGTPERGDAANPPMDMNTILPDLPPRRQMTENVSETAAGVGDDNAGDDNA